MAVRDDWPHTARILPWCIAALLAMLFLVPFDSIQFAVTLPFDAKLDRVVLLVCLVLWALVAATTPWTLVRPAHRFGVPEVLVAIFVLVCFASVFLALPTLTRLNETQVSLRRLALLVSYLAFFVFVVSNVRASEVRAFTTFVVGLAVIAAVGTIVEYRTLFNVFYSGAAALLPPGVNVSPHATVMTPDGRIDVSGPTRHGLAMATMLAMALPFALVRATAARATRTRVLFVIAAALIFAGAISTVRRSGVVLPFVAVVVLAAFGGRRMLPVIGVFGMLLLAMPVIAPNAATSLVNQLSGHNVGARQSLGGRTSDYAAVAPDIRHRAVIGRGFGSYDPRRYRFLDNQALALLIETGVVGLGTYLAMVLAGIAAGIAAARRRVGELSWLALAAAAAMTVFLVANVLFDALSFAHAPYLFLAILAFAMVVRRSTELPSSDPLA
jgi:O-antigen ligase